MELDLLCEFDVPGRWAGERTVVGMREQECCEEHSEYLDFPKRMVTPGPCQFPHPLAWIAAAFPSSARMAGGERGRGEAAACLLASPDVPARGTPGGGS